MSMPKTLVRRRQRRYEPLAVLSYIVQYQRQHQRRSPSQRCIQISLGVSAPSVVHNLLRRLEHNGLLMITTHGRGHLAELALTDAGHDAVQTWRAERARAYDASLYGTGRRYDQPV